MESRSGRRSSYFVSKAALLSSVCLCFFFFCALFTGSCRWSSYSLEITSSRAASNATVRAAALGGRRRLGEWPGSYPPRCAAKCGACTPCRPVHVSVPPGTPVTAEYYPEAWRCKCGDKLYMP